MLTTARVRYLQVFIRPRAGLPEERVSAGHAALGLPLAQRSDLRFGSRGDTVRVVQMEAAKRADYSIGLGTTEEPTDDP